MNKIRKISKFVESESLELKRSTSELKEAIISIVAMLNKHHKGKIYFGIKNNGGIIGQDVTENTLREISQSIAAYIEPKIYPEIKLVKINTKKCIAVIFEGNDSPYFAYGRAYIRVSDEDKKISVKELEHLFKHKHIDNYSWDAQPSQLRIKNINVKILKDYVKKSNSIGRIDFKFDNTKNILKKLNLMKNNHIRNAAKVLFCNDNTLEVQAAVFAGTDKTTFIDIKQFKGDIFTLLELSEQYISQRMNWRAEIGKLERKEIPEIPIKSIREALVNSFCHRNYCAPESNKIAIYTNRIEIYNPGEFPEGLTPQDFIKGTEQSILRNPIIAEVLYKSKEIEKWGSGLKRIFEECSSAKINVEFNMLKTGFMVVFYRKNIANNNTGEKISISSDKVAISSDKLIIEYLTHHKEITNEVARNITGLSPAGVRKIFVKLTKKKIIIPIGKGKHRVYTIKKN